MIDYRSLVMRSTVQQHNSKQPSEKHGIPKFRVKGLKNMSKTCQISPHIQTALQISNYWADYTFYHLSIVFIKSWDAFRDSSPHLAAAAAAADHGCCSVHSPRFPPLAGQIASAWRTWWPYQHEPSIKIEIEHLPPKSCQQCQYDVSLYVVEYGILLECMQCSHILVSHRTKFPCLFSVNLHHLAYTRLPSVLTLETGFP